jgi:hypothetical protein
MVVGAIVVCVVRRGAARRRGRRGVSQRWLCAAVARSCARAECGGLELACVGGEGGGARLRNVCGGVCVWAGEW